MSSKFELHYSLSEGDQDENGHQANGDAASSNSWTPKIEKRSDAKSIQQVKFSRPVMKRVESGGLQKPQKSTSDFIPPSSENSQELTDSLQDFDVSTMVNFGVSMTKSTDGKTAEKQNKSHDKKENNSKSAPKGNVTKLKETEPKSNLKKKETLEERLAREAKMREMQDEDDFESSGNSKTISKSEVKPSELKKNTSNTKIPPSIKTEPKPIKTPQKTKPPTPKSLSLKKEPFQSPSKLKKPSTPKIPLEKVVEPLYISKLDYNYIQQLPSKVEEIEEDDDFVATPPGSAKRKLPEQLNLTLTPTKKPKEEQNQKTSPSKLISPFIKKEEKPQPNYMSWTSSKKVCFLEDSST